MVANDAGGSAPGGQVDSGKRASPDPMRVLGWVPKVGVAAWSFIGVVVAITIVVFALAAVSEIVLPLTFAAVLAVCFKPVTDFLHRRGVKRTAAAGIVVLGLLALATLVGVATVKGVTQQAGEISDSINAAIDKLVAELDADQEWLESARGALEDMAPTGAAGFLTELVEGLSKLVGLASGLILGALIMYYLSARRQ